MRVLPRVRPFGTQAWVRYAKFEMQHGQIGLARQCYERAVEELGEEGQTVGCSPVGCPTACPCCAAANMAAAAHVQHAVRAKWRCLGRGRQWAAPLSALAVAATTAC